MKYLVYYNIYNKNNIIVIVANILISKKYSYIIVYTWTKCNVGITYCIILSKYMSVIMFVGIFSKPFLTT